MISNNIRLGNVIFNFPNLNLSPNLGIPPTIQKISLLLSKANLLAWKLVALESLIKILLFFFRKNFVSVGQSFKRF